MALTDDLRKYISEHGRPEAPKFSESRVVIVGEYHGHAAIARLNVSLRLLRHLLRDGRYRFFGNESFLNAGPIRRGVREYLGQGKLPPPFNPDDGDISREEKGKRFFTNAFKPLLDDLRADPKYVLHIGSRGTRDARDPRIAQHFFDEMLDRGVTPRTPGVLLLGAAHAAAAPFDKGQTTTRMYLERKGYDCVSVLVLTDSTRDGQADDRVVATTGKVLESVRLTSLIGSGSVTVSTRHQLVKGPPSPFHNVRLEGSDSGKALAAQFEYLMLART